MKEKQELFQKCLSSEQTLSDVKRDAELKDIKIESLQNIIAKREQQAGAKFQGAAGKGKKDMSAVVERLEREKNSLGQEVEILREEIQGMD